MCVSLCVCSVVCVCCIRFLPLSTRHFFYVLRLCACCTALSSALKPTPSPTRRRCQVPFSVEILKNERTTLFFILSFSLPPFLCTIQHTRVSHREREKPQWHTNLFSTPAAAGGKRRDTQKRVVSLSHSCCHFFFLFFLFVKKNKQFCVFVSTSCSTTTKNWFISFCLFFFCFNRCVESNEIISKSVGIFSKN